MKKAYARRYPSVKSSLSKHNSTRRNEPTYNRSLLYDRPLPYEELDWAESSPLPNDQLLHPVAFEDRMNSVRFVVHERPHITIDNDACRGCTTKACVTACPAGLFVPTADGGILFNYEQCFECGTCYMVCNNKGAINWNYPIGGYGVEFRYA
ncbi:MAG: hypothetical protein M1131_02900 [Actinobacteria bacterium]|jgi:ferredoxin like protein|nr:hypothetical protein [Actinomycetota bacterium]MCL6095969.1 hypothetical protein [Actinomycetota bacterium]